MKICNKCKLEKDFIEFYKNNATKDNYTYYCKDCIKKYKKDNKDKINKKRREYKLKQKLINPKFNLIKNLRHRIGMAFKAKYWRKDNTTQYILGSDFNTVKEYLESKFLENMSWENRNLWHIDHIIPLSLANTEEELIKLCHYTNLQPLWAEDNIKKSNKLI
jgi:hypothetical protein